MIVLLSIHSFHLIQSHDRKPLRLYVYNSDNDGCREVLITPNSQWGGEGLFVNIINHKCDLLYKDIVPNPH